MYADLRMIPHESALFSSACKPTSLGVVSGQVTAKASASQVPWLALCVWLQKGVREDMAWSKHIDLYAFSRGSFRKKARNLIETAQRKSHPLEGSRQEAILLPSTTFDILFVAFRSAHSTPA